MERYDLGSEKEVRNGDVDREKVEDLASNSNKEAVSRWRLLLSQAYSDQSELIFEE
jgi:hypothetical protein